MAGSLRPYTFRVVTPVQVMSRLTKKQLAVCGNDGQSHLGPSTRSSFLIQFLSQRSIGSTALANAQERRQLAEVVSEIPQFQMSSYNSHHDICGLLNITSFHSSHMLNNRMRDHCVQPIPHIGQNSGICYSQVYPYSLYGNDSSAPMISEYEKQMILLSETKTNTDTEPPQNESGKPTLAQLEHVKNSLSEHLPKLFVQTLDFRIYHPNLIFENNIKGTRNVGLYHYVKQVALLRIIGHLRFAYVKFNILKITTHPEDGTVKVRWRISGISGMRILFNFWKINILKLKDSIEKHQEAWYDGFSTFHVDSGGLVYKLVVDKMMPDPEIKPVTDSSLTAKLALMVGLLPRECSELSHIISIIQENSKCLSDVMLPLDQIE